MQILAYIHKFPDTVPNGYEEYNEISGYITDITYSYSINAPYETASIKAKIPIAEVQPLFFGADHWVTIHELIEDTDIKGGMYSGKPRKVLKFLGLINSLNTGAQLTQDGAFTSVETTISCQSWVSILMKAPFKVVDDAKLNAINQQNASVYPPIETGLRPLTDFFETLVPIFQDFLDPKEAFKTAYRLFSSFEIPPSIIKDGTLAQMPLITTKNDFDKANIKRAFAEIIGTNFNVIQPSINGSLWSLLTKSFVAGLDGLIELFPSYETLAKTRDQSPFVIESLFEASNVSNEQVSPCLIYRYRPIDNRKRSIKGTLVGSDKSPVEKQKFKVTSNEATSLENGLETNAKSNIEYTSVEIDTNFNVIKAITIAAIEVTTVTSFSLAFSADKRLNLVDITTKATGVMQILGVLTDFVYDARALDRFGAIGYEATYPFFGSDNDGTMKEYAFELSKYYSALYKDGQKFANASVNCYFTPTVRHGEYVNCAIYNYNGTQWYLRGYCVAVAHTHRALTNGQIQRMTQITLERAYIYAP